MTGVVVNKVETKIHLYYIIQSLNGWTVGGDNNTNKYKY